jgi:sugar (pentulose or hexulose) kinase
MSKADHLPQLDADKIDADYWWQAVQICILEQAKSLKLLGVSASDITRIAVDGTSGSMVMTDVNLNPVSRALMYNSKGFVTQAEQIAKVAPKVHITQGSASALGRAMCLASEAGGRARYLMHQADFIAAKLMGVGGHSDFNNALKTGFDPETNSWPKWIGQVIDPSLLPTVHGVGTQLHGINPVVANDLGLSSSAVICAGTTDSIAAFLASAPMKTGVAVTSLGSTLAIKMLSTTRIDDPNVGLYSHRVGDAWLVGGASNTGGAVLAHYFDSDTLNTLSQLMDINTPTGLDYYPLLRSGERFPINDPNLAPRLTPRPDSDVLFLQGMLESIARIENACYSAIETRGGGRPTTIFSAGGGAQNPTFTKLRAKALGLPISNSSQTEAAIGAAYLAGMSL